MDDTTPAPASAPGPASLPARVRDAVPDDLPGITAIYNRAVRTGTAIWNDTEVDVDDRRAWLLDRTRRGHPVLVVHDADGAVAGYASFGDWRPHDGFRHTVEHSVYVREGDQGRGLGRALLTELVGRARADGKHVMVAAVESGNAASIALHGRLGFVVTGRMPEVGRKFDRWLDLTFLQLALDPA